MVCPYTYIYNLFRKFSTYVTILLTKGKYLSDLERFNYHLKKYADNSGLLDNKFKLDDFREDYSIVSKGCGTAIRGWQNKTGIEVFAVPTVRMLKIIWKKTSCKNAIQSILQPADTARKVRNVQEKQ